MTTEGGNTGTAWLDAIGFYGIEEGSYDEWDLLPPDSYEDYIDGTVSAEENFDQYSGEEDLDFYLTWANTELVRKRRWLCDPFHLYAGRQHNSQHGLLSYL